MATQANESGLLARLSDELAEAVERTGRAVVTVDGRPRGAATGILWPRDGVVVTANHVLERNENIIVTYPGGEKVAATIAGRDRGSDLAVLRVAGNPPPPVELHTGRSVRVGQLAVALGRPGYDVMATFGIVSATGGRWRTATGGTLEAYIRADIGLLPGFSGGPLIDAAGRVIGINSWHLANGQEVAIPTASAGEVVEALLAHGAIKRGYLGVSSQRVALPEASRAALGWEQDRGLIIVGVESGSPAEQAGLLVGDILVSIDGQVVTRPDELRVALGPATVGRAVPAVVIRGGARHDLSLTPGSRD